MNPAQLLQHFESLAETQEAVAKLHKLILRLAAEGRLLPADKNPESAKELATQLEKTRVKAVAAGVARKQKPVPVTDAERFIQSYPNIGNG